MLTASVLLMLLVFVAADYCHTCTVQPTIGRQMYESLQTLHDE